MDSKELFDHEVKKCGGQNMTVEERRAAYAYFLRGLALQRHEVGQLRELERSYTHQLGEMARLCDIVCVHIWSAGTGGDGAVMDAITEIAEYVDAVRPPEGSKPPEWVVHIIGPDDIHDCRGEFDALRRANQHNRSYARLMADDPKPNDPYCVAVAVTKEMLAESV